MLMWDMRHMWQYLMCPLLFLLPESDQIIRLDTQKRHYESLRGPKRMHIQKGATHMDILEGANQKEVTQMQVEFISDALDGQVV